MAEEIAILIKAVNEASGTLQKVQKDTDSLAKNSVKANKSLGESFKAVQGAMLNLGQVAQGIHNIFEIQQNKTRRLENATDRLENAQIRLKNATKDLSKAYKKLNDIETAHRRDTVTLERAKLNLIQAEFDLKEAVAEHGKESMQARQATLDLTEAEMDLADAQDLGRQKAEELNEANQEIIDKNEELKISQNGVDTAQRNLNKAIGDAKWMYVDMGMQVLSVAGNLGTFFSTISKNTGTLKGLSSIVGSGALAGAGTVSVAAGVGLVGGFLALGGAVAAIDYYTQIETTKMLTEKYLKLHPALKDVIVDFKKLQEMEMQSRATGAERRTTIGFGQKNVNLSAPSGAPGGLAPIGGYKITGPSPTVKKVGDAIIRPNGQVIETSPDDTLFASKSGFGTTIIINGNNYGISADEIANSLMEKIKNKISI